MKHLLHALESRRHKLSVSDADLDQLLSEVKDARDVKGPEQFTDSLEKVLQDLKSLPEAHAFLKPVTRSDAPDYHLVIKHPMDLATMSKKVRTKQYRNKAEFISDLNLIWDNCLTYNAHPTHPLRRCANTLRKRTAILSEIIQDPADRSAPLTLRRMPQIRRRSVVDDSDDDYHSSSGGRPVNRSRTLNGNINGADKTVNGNAINGRVSSTPESDVPMRPTVPRSGKSRRPLPEESFPDRSAITRTQESMSQFASLDKELARLELQTAGAGPSRIKEDFMHEELDRRLRNQLRQIRANDEDVQRLDEWRDVDESKVGGGGKRKRVVITSSDEEEDETPRRTKFSTTGLPQDQEQHETHHDLWWEAMRSGGMIGNGVLQMAQHGFPDVKPGIMRRRKKRPKDTGLKGKIHKNIITLNNIRRVHTKILVLNALVEENQGNNEDIPIPPDSPTTEPPIFSIPGLTLAEDSGAACLNQVSTTVLQHAGFEGSSQAALNMLQHVVADYLENVGRTFRFMLDTFGKSMSNEQIVLHALAEHGISEVQELERYVKDDVERYGTRLQDLERKLTHAYDEQTQAGAMEDDELFDEENENLVMGGFAGELGEDFFGLRELGLDQEFGLTSLSIPRKLLRTKKNNASNANATKEPQLPYPPPSPFHPIHTASLESHIGLLHPFYASKAPAPLPSTEGATDPPTGVILPDDPANNLKVKMGPLGQIISVTPSTSKKKGGGNGGGGGGGDGGVKPEGTATGSAPSKSQKKKDKDKKPPPPPSDGPPLMMPKFGIGTAKSPVAPPPPPPPEVSTMMPDFSQFITGVHAGV